MVDDAFESTMLEAFMYEFINSVQFAQYLFDREDHAEKGGSILQAMLEARSPRLSDISHRMSGNPAASYKAIQRFLDQTDPKGALLRLYQEDAPFVIGDPTEIPRPQARKTGYVGVLKDGKTRGFWLLTLATPYRGRAIPFSIVSYSSRTIAQQANSRNLEHFEAFLDLKQLLGEKPLVLDREFSYGLLLENLVAAGIHFVIRLRLGSNPPLFLNDEGRRIELNIAQDGKVVVFRQLYYQGQTAVHIIGIWRKGFKQPLWVMTDLAPDQGLTIYQARTKIEQSFRDLKSLLNLDKLMNKSQANMEKMVALMMIAYTMGVFVGEAIRDHKYAGNHQENEERDSPNSRKQWKLYSGLFILLKHKIDLAVDILRDLVGQALRSFADLTWGDVRTLV
jgi:hypothetical protein